MLEVSGRNSLCWFLASFSLPGFLPGVDFIPILSLFYPYFYFHFISMLSMFYPHFMSTLSLFFLYFFLLLLCFIPILSPFYPHFPNFPILSLYSKKDGKRLGNDIRYLTQRKTHSFSGNTTKNVGKRYFLESKKCQKFPKAYKNGISAAGRRILFGVLIFEQCKRR